MLYPGRFSTQAAGAPDRFAIGFIEARGLRALPCDVSYTVGDGKYLTLGLTEVDGRRLVWSCGVTMYKTNRQGSPFQHDVAEYRDGFKELRPPRRRPVDPSAFALSVPEGWRHEAFRDAHSSDLIHTYLGPTRGAIVSYRLNGPGLGRFRKFDEVNRLLHWAPDAWVVHKQYVEVGPVAPVNEAAVPAAMREEINASAARARASLKLPAGASPLAVQQAINETVDGVLAARKRPAKTKLEDLAIDLGCLWGQAVCDALGWEWRQLDLDGKKVYAVTTKDRSHYVAPAAYLRRQLGQRRAGADNTTLLLFNMLKAGEVPHSPARGFKSLG